jgi:acyl-homoserine-lactone acylase
MRRTVILAVAMALVVASGASAAPPAAAEGNLHATIRRTGNGIPHVVADSYGGMGFGIGYAFAQDNICTAADFYVTVNGERSKFFGPDGRWQFRGNGSSVNNRNSDFFYTAINESGVIEDLLAEPPPAGPLPGVFEGVKGYVAGYNQYLEDVGGPDGISDPRCKGKPWVRPITEMDAYRRFFQLASLASAGIAINEIGGAQPPTPDMGGFGGAAAAASSGVTAGQQQLIRQIPSRLSRGARHRLQRLRLGGTRPQRHGDGARQPALPVARRRAAVPDAPDHPRRGGRVRARSLYGVPLVLIGTPRGGVEPHRVDRVPVHPVRADPRAGLADHLPGRRTARRDGGARGHRRGPRRGRHDRDRGVPECVVDRLRARSSPASSACRCSRGRRRRPSRWGRQRPPALPQPVLRVEPRPDRRALRTAEDLPRHPVGQHHRGRLAGKAYYADISVVPNVPDEQGPDLPTALGLATFVALGLPVLDGSPQRVQLGHRPRRGAGHLRPVQPPPPVPRRLRPQRQRQLLADQPERAARGLRAHHRRRTRRTDPADPHRARDGRGPGWPARTSTPPRTRTGSPRTSCRTWSSTTGSTPAN